MTTLLSVLMKQIQSLLANGQFKEIPIIVSHEVSEEGSCEKLC